MDAAAELGRNPLSKDQIQPEYGDKQADAGRNCRTPPVSGDQILRRERGQEILISPVELTTIRISNLTRSIDPYSCYMCDYTYIHTVVQYTEYIFCTMAATVQFNRI